MDALEARVLLAGQPRISEFLAINSNGLKDSDNAYSDWIEIENPATTSVDLDGLYLSDDSSLLAKWRIPSTVLGPGERVVIFASGKNRAVSGQQLHTDFEISGNGGYLALLAADGVTKLTEYLDYPQQVANVSYGTQFLQVETPALVAGEAGKYLVPAGPVPGWTEVGFDDSGWTGGSSGYGYDVDPAPTMVSGFKVNMIDAATGTLANIEQATTLLNGNTTGFTIATNTTVIHTTVNYGDAGNFTPNINYPNDPTGLYATTNGVNERNLLALRVTATLTIPAGTWAINVGSDDGCRLTLPGITFTSRVGESAGATSPADTFQYVGTRGHGNTFGVFTITSPITVQMQVDAFEGAGGDSLEISIAQNTQTTFSTTAFQLLADGVKGWQVRSQSLTNPVTFADLITTNVGAAMQNVNASLYVRMPFGVEDADAFEAIRLKMRYDDGFIAYLNGQELLRRNAPASELWNSAALNNRDELLVHTPDEWNLEIPAGLLVEGQNVLAIQALNDSAASLDFVMLPELSVVELIETQQRYFNPPTPGTINGVSDVTQQANDPSFSHDRGFYDAPFNLVVEANSPGGVVRYTTNGTAPTASSPIFPSSLLISGTTTIRAATFAPGMLASNSDTQTYLFLNDVVQQSWDNSAPAGWATSWTPNTTDYGMDPDVVLPPAGGIVYNGVYYFAASDAASGLELWRSDGTTGGTYMLKDINPGTAGSGPSGFMIFNNMLVFRASTLAKGYELWKSDGTAGGTVLIKDSNTTVNPNGASDGINGQQFTIVGTKMFFAGAGSGGTELWVTDLTSAGTVRVKDINTNSAVNSGSSLPANLVNVNGTLFFTANNGVNGVELWKSDGTSAGTVMVKDINATGTSGVNSSTPTSLINFNGTLYFAATNGVNGIELWKSDGTSAGTVMVKDINPTGTSGVNASSPASLTVMGSYFYFSANDGTNGAELWKSDGTTAGTVMMQNINSGSASSSPTSLVVVGSNLYFMATTAAAGNELYISNGTTATLTKDINAGTGGSTISIMTPLGSRLVFALTNAANGLELWSSDGTSAGTGILQDINPGAISSRPRDLTVFSGSLYFSADDGSSGRELWKTDGTSAGTLRVKDLAPGAAAGNPSSLAVLGSQLMFLSGNNASPALGVWKTAGTEATTAQVTTLANGNAATLQFSDLKAIPTMSIVMNLNDMFGTTGIYSNPSNAGRAWERPASLELINPDGSTGFQINAGIRLRGGFSRSTGNPKHGLRFVFRGEYGESKLEYPLFGDEGADEFDGIDLRTFQNYSWSFQNDVRGIFMRDQFSRDTALDLGQIGPHGEYYHLYINGQYFGIYNTDERPEASFGATYFGGDEAEYDVIKVNTPVYQVYATDGNVLAWEDLWAQCLGVKALADAAQDTTAAYMKILGKNPDGTRNPAYPVLLDVDNLIDYMLTIFYAGNRDAPITAGADRPNNFYASRNRNSDEGFRFFVHDAEHTLLSVNEDRTGPYALAVDPNEARLESNPQFMFQLLSSAPEFRLQVNDHIYKAFFNDGALTPAKSLARFNERVVELRRAIYAESARWGDSRRGSYYPLGAMEWENEVYRLTVDDPATGTANDSYFSLRTGIVLTQLQTDLFYQTAAPTLLTPGGTITTGTPINVSNPHAGSTVYYTIDGSDPRLVGGGVSPTAQVYTGFFTLPTSSLVKVRVLLGTGAWSAMAEQSYVIPYATLKIAEVMYNPTVPAGSAYVSEDFEFIELVNTGTQAINLTGVQFTEGITFAFPAGTLLAAGGRAVVARNLAAFAEKYGSSAGVFGPYTGVLSDNGETVTLADGVGTTIVSFDYKDGWYAISDGTNPDTPLDATDGGYSLVVRDPAGASNSLLSTGAGWRPSNLPQGAPGYADPGINPGAVVINEVLANASGPLGDWIELKNTTGQAIDVSGWFVSDSLGDLEKYQIAPGTVIAPGGFLMLSWLNHFGRAGTTGVNTPFDLSRVSAEIYLSNQDGAGNAAGYREHADFAGTDADRTMGRWLKSDGSSDMIALAWPTPGAENAGPLIGPVIINEVMYNPNAGQKEFIELRNLTGGVVSLEGWKFVSGVDFTFPAGATIPAYGYILVVGDNPLSYSAPPGVAVYGPYTDSLSNSGEDLKLSRPGVVEGAITPFILVDKLKWSDASPWPAEPDGTGATLARLEPLNYGNDVVNWASSAAGGTPGLPNFATNTPVVDAWGDAVISAGGSLVRAGSFDDPDANVWTATVNYGDGSGPQSLTLNPDKSFALSRAYPNPGTYVVTVSVSDGTGRTGGTSFRVAATPGPRLGTAGNDTFSIRLDPGGTSVQIWENQQISSPPSYALPRTALGSFHIDALGGDDALVIDMSFGSPIPAGGITFIGADGAADRVQVIGAPSANAVTVGASNVVIGANSLVYAATEIVQIDGGPENDVLSVSETPGAALVFNGGQGQDTLAVTGGTLTVGADLSGSTYSPAVTVSGTGIVQFTSPQHLRSLSLSGAGKAVITPGGVHTLSLDALSIATGAALDLGDNALIIHSSDAQGQADYTALFALLASGRAAGAWNGTGIRSSSATAITGLALLMNRDNAGNPLFGTFGSEAVGADDLLVKLTYVGDTNFDGRIDIDDYFIIDTGYARGLTGYRNGDFNYSTGVASADDYFAIDLAFLQQGGPMATPSPAPVAAPMPFATEPLKLFAEDDSEEANVWE